MITCRSDGYEFNKDKGDRMYATPVFCKLFFVFTRIFEAIHDRIQFGKTAELGISVEQIPGAESNSETRQ